MLLDGRTVANTILAELIIRVDSLAEKGIIPHLAVVKVGNDPATTSYVSQKEKKGKEIGAVVSVYNHPENITQEKIQEAIDFLRTDESIHGIILQLPISKHLDEKSLIASIPPSKDVDGFVKNSPFTVPIAAAVFKLLEVPCAKETLITGESFNEWLNAKNVVVMGKGTTGGLPIIKEMQKRGVEPTIIDSTTPNPTLITKAADIIITAVGKKGVLTKNMVEPGNPDGSNGTILLNIGMTRGDDEKFYGDYDDTEMADIASWYTPTPGGVGPVNVACLLENLIIAAENLVKN